MNEIRYIVSLNAQLIHRVFSQRLSRTLPSISVRGPPRHVSRFSLQRQAFGSNDLNARRWLAKEKTAKKEKSKTNKEANWL